jgi:hypothetical protein|tara:strand:- start:1312 stop:1479 length:168 start_codon:yes stop_codon:yes gene_type:complete
MKNYIINGEEIQGILRYLFTRPYGEVIKLIETLGKLRVLDDNIDANFLSKKQEKK